MKGPKRDKFLDSLKSLDKKQLSKSQLLSDDLSERVGNLKDRMKVTIRLDSSIVERAKEESLRLGVGYQQILNDRLKEVYDLGSAPYLQFTIENGEPKDLARVMSALKRITTTLEEQSIRIKKLEKKRA